MEQRAAPSLFPGEGERMTPEDALEVGMCLGRKYRRVAVARDSSSSSAMIVRALTSGVISAGAHAIDAGVVPAPAACVAFALEADCIASVGSPESWGDVSGIILHNPDGSQFSSEQITDLLAPPEDPTGDALSGIGRATTDFGASRRYVSATLRNGMKSGGYVIMDCGCGSSATCAPWALTAAGADVVSLNAHSGSECAPRSPGIDKTELASLSDFVNASIGSVGIAYNGDCTRFALLDENGKFVQGDMLLALMIMYLEPRIAVVPFDAPAVVENAFGQGFGLREDEKDEGEPKRRLVRTRGDIESVTDAIRKNGADFGGLLNGTFIFPKNSLCPDAIYGSAVITELAGIRSIRNMMASLPTYSTAVRRVRHDGTMERFGKNFLRRITEYDVSEVVVGDGWKVIMKNGQYIVNVDPDDPRYMRIAAESQDRVYLVTMLEQASEIVEASARLRFAPPPSSRPHTACRGVSSRRGNCRPPSFSCRMAGR